MSVNFDHSRGERIGIPEVILAEPKTNIDLQDALVEAWNIDKKQKSILITRILQFQVIIIETFCFENKINVTFDKYQRTAILGHHQKKTITPKIAILSGGTSDQPVVEEIKMSLNYLGLADISYCDIGVAGIHRHYEALQNIETIGSIKLLIVVAGNEGALFSVIASQTPLPIIAVPSSIGYGFGGRGLTALQSALQSCSPGVVTVNIDNGFGAAVFAKRLISIIDG